jgi:uncharacterized protein
MMVTEGSIPDTPLSDVERAELAAFLVSDAVSEEAMTLPMLDGFLTGMLSGPNRVPQNIWLPLVWGNGSDGENERGKDPSFVSDEQKQRIISLILRHGNAILRALNHGSCAPLYVTAPEQERRTCAEEWSAGYVCGMWCDKESWLPILEDEEGSQFLIPMLVPAAPPDFFDEKPTDEDVEAAISMMATAAVGVFLYWRMGGLLPGRKKKGKRSGGSTAARR